MPELESPVDLTAGDSAVLRVGTEPVVAILAEKYTWTIHNTAFDEAAFPCGCVWVRVGEGEISYAPGERVHLLAPSLSMQLPKGTGQIILATPPGAAREPLVNFSCAKRTRK